MATFIVCANNHAKNTVQNIWFFPRNTKKVTPPPSLISTLTQYVILYITDRPYGKRKIV
jgi:hypothetical protein